MEQINSKLSEAALTLANGKGNSIQLNREAPEWLPIEITEQYNKTDLTYDFCIQLYGMLEAAKREKIPMETARQWFIEFVRRGWTKAMLIKRYDALLATKIFGIEKLDFSDWVNAVQTFSEDETNLKVGQRVEAMITKGRFLKDKKVELTEEEKKCVELWAAQDAELRYNREKAEAMEDRRNERREIFYRRLSGG